MSRMIVAEEAMPRMAAGRRNCRKKPTGAVANSVNPVAGRHPHQIAGQHDHERRQPEPGNGQPEDGGAPRGVVLQRVLAHRRDDAHRHRDQDGEEDGEDAERQRHRQPPPELLHDRAACPQRLAEVAADHPARPLDVLHVERTVQAELRAQLLRGPSRTPSPRA